MKHLKRRAIERSWPLPKKGTKYVMKPYPGKKKEITLPIGIILRDMLKLVASKKEIRALLNAKDVVVDNKIIKKEKFPISIFDIISLPKLNKHFLIILNESGKISLQEINEKDAGLKVCKVIGKNTMKKGIQQINCFDGRNFICKDKIAVNDSLLIDLKNNKIVKVLPFKVGAESFIIGGAQTGLKGKISEINKKIKIHIKNRDFEVQAKNIYIIEK